jgi:hypothetical protein
MSAKSFSSTTVTYGRYMHSPFFTGDLISSVILIAENSFLLELVI